MWFLDLVICNSFIAFFTIKDGLYSALLKISGKVYGGFVQIKNFFSTDLSLGVLSGRAFSFRIAAGY